jgi:hypothetical protein
LLHDDIVHEDAVAVVAVSVQETGPAATEYDYGQGVDVLGWITNDLSSLKSRLDESVIGLVPQLQWHEQVDHGGSSIAHLLLHLARHQDLAVATAIRNHVPLFTAHRDALGLAEAPAWAGLGEREEPAVTTVVPAAALVAYLDAVFEATSGWLHKVAGMALDTVPDTSRRLDAKAGLTTDDVGWLHRMWSGKPVWWLVQWPVIGHGNAHTGEAIAVRNRMGLSPF